MKTFITQVSKAMLLLLIVFGLLFLLYPQQSKAGITKNGGKNYRITAAPSISSFSPASAGATMTVTISGSSFTGATSVRFGGTNAASFSVVNDNTITAVVAAGTSGSISVVTAGGTGTRAGFTFCTAVTPTISISTSSATSCAGSNVHFSSSISNGGASPTYQWTKNRVAVSGQTDTAFDANNLSNSDTIRCVLTSNASCATTTTATSAAIVVVINSLPIVSLSNTAINNCVNTASLSVSGAGTASFIRWYNGATLASTATSTPVSSGSTFAGDNGSGSGANQFNTLTDIFGDANGNIYLADYGNNRIQKFAPGSTSSSTGTTVAGGNGVGASANKFNSPIGVFVDASGNIFVADRFNHRIQKFPANSTSSTNGTTVAGGNGSGSAANQLSSPTGIYVDGQGNIYVADRNNNRIQRFPANSTSSTNGTTIAGGNGVGSAANQLNAPYGVYLDASGNLLVVDNGNHRIQKFPSGSTSSTNATTVAGGNGFGSAANQLNSPRSLFIDLSGNFYVADYSNNRVQKFPSSSTSSTSGVTVAGGNGSGSASNQLNSPFAAWVDGSGNIYVADQGNNRVHLWATGAPGTTYSPSSNGSFTAQVTDLNGCAATTNAISVDPNLTPSVNIAANLSTICSGDAITFTATPTNGGTPSYVWRKNNATQTGETSATYTTSSLSATDTVTAIMTSNLICLTNASATSNGVTATVNPLPSITLSNSGANNCIGTAALSVSGATAASNISWLKSAVLDSISPFVSGTTGTIASGGNGSGASATQLNVPTGVFVDANGNTFVADYNNHRIQRFAAGSSSSTSGVTVAGGNGVGNTATRLNGPSSVFVDSAGNIYVADRFNNRIQKFPAGSTSATSGVTVAGGNGAGSAANQLNSPMGVFVDASGNIYVGDRNNYRVQKFPANSTSATNGTTVAGGNGGGAGSNQLSLPYGVYVDSSNILYVTDYGNHRIQRFPANSTSATNGTTIAGGNGVGSALNQMNNPRSIHIDYFGNLYVADYENNRVLLFPSGSTSSTNGIVVAGGNGSGNAANQLSNPYGVFADNAGNLFVTDQSNNRVQKWNAYTPKTTYAPNTTGSFTVRVTDRNGCINTSNAVNVNPYVVPAVSITVTDTLICYDGGVTFTATPTNGGIEPNYLWKKNSVTISSDTSSSITLSATLNNRDTIVCVMTNTNACLAPTSATSNSIVISKLLPTTNTTNLSGCGSVSYNAQTYNTSTVLRDTVRSVRGCDSIYNVVNINVTTPVTPSVTIVGSASTICQTNPVTFTATPTNGGVSPAYQWKLNGINVGTNATTYVNGALANGDSITCELTSDVACVTASTALSNTVNMTVNTKPNLGNDTTVYVCAGSTRSISTLYDTAGFTTVTWSSPTPTAVAGGSHSLYVINSVGCSDTAVITVTENPLPTIPSISTTGSTSFCFNDSVILNNSATGTLQWLRNNSNIKNATTSRYAARVSGTYKLRVTTINGCTAISADSVVVTATQLAKPTITLSNDTLFSSSLSGNQWFSSGFSINGATASAYAPDEIGYYTVQVTSGGCTSPISDPFVYYASTATKHFANNSFEHGSLMVKLYPNPSYGTAYLQLSGVKNAISITVTGLLGNVVSKYEVKKDTRIDLSNLRLSKGIYIITLNEGGNRKELKWFNAK